MGMGVHTQGCIQKSNLEVARIAFLDFRRGNESIRTATMESDLLEILALIKTCKTMLISCCIVLI